jgi:hypothetical protein
MQSDSIASMNRRYLYRTDSLWTPVARYYASLPAEYNDREAFERYISARHAQVDMLIVLARAVRDLLTAEQERRLSQGTLNALDPRYLESIRNGMGQYLSGSGR